ncbi:MAG: serine hydrolase domain-containing protein [Janthinobacterium lividum]
MADEVRIDTAALDKLLDPYDRTNAPGFAVGVALRGKPGYRRGVGLASVELPVALSPTIRMRIGSTSKHFCVLAVMLLAEDGRLSIDDSPRRLLPELPAWAEAMTIRQLMAHTSGMRDSFDVFQHTTGMGRQAPPDMLFKLAIALDDLNFEPGTSWNYNNAGYVLLTEIIERVAGQPFADFLRERVLEPVGMFDTLHRPLDTDLVPNSATLHVPAPGGGWTRGVFPTPIGGMGGVVSTVDDMLLWLRHMSHPTVGTAETWAAMCTPLTTSGYGLGLSMTSHRGLHTVHHAGAVVGGRSQMLKVLDHDLDLIVLSNGFGMLPLYNLVDAIIDACIPDLPPVSDAADAVDAGVFYSAKSGRLLKLVEQEGRQLLDIGGAALPTRSEADGALSIGISFFPTDLLVTPVLEGDAAAALEITEFGTSDRLDRVEPPANAENAGIAGRYANTPASIDATIARDPVGAVTLHVATELGAVTYMLTPIAPDVWQGKGPPELPLTVTLEFDAQGVLLSTGRTTRLRFKHVP